MANITETITRTLPTSIVGKTFYLTIGTGGPDYCPGKFDWVRVTTSSGSNLLTDTGITANQCYQAGSDALVSCTSAAAIALNSSQDGMSGSDVSNPSNADGKLGFSYSTVGSYAKTECVKDNITGLTWEGKTATGTRAGSATYTNYDNTTQGVNLTQGQIDAATNAVGYKNAVNASALCGYTDWRLPTADELQSLVDYGVANPGPMTDISWFSNASSSYYWTSSPYAGHAATYAWVVSFLNGDVGSFSSNLRNSYLGVRLVR